MARLQTITKAQIRLDAGRHPLEEKCASAIEADWQNRHAANPRLYDGETVLGTRLVINAGQLHATCRVIRYAGLLHFLGLPQAQAAGMAYRHVYAWPALVSSDGCAIMGRMAAHTANAGRIYFPSGSLEAVDFVDGIADLEANMARELAEETGLVLGEASLGADMLLWQGARTAALMRICRFDETADQLVKRVRQFQVQSGEDELDGVLAFAPGQVHRDMAEGAKAFMVQFSG